MRYAGFEVFVAEMECCHHVVVVGDENGGIVECHPYVIGTYKKIGVCGGRSIYQHDNNTEIFMYYGCGRWFIGLEVRTVVLHGSMILLDRSLWWMGVHQDTFHLYPWGAREALAVRV